GASPVILCGDLNTRPNQEGYKIITQLGALVDTFHELHIQHPITSAKDNPYTQSDNQCLDYVLVRNASVQSIDLVMTENLSGDILAYSDHYGLLAVVGLNGTRLHQENSQIAWVIELLYQRVSDGLLDIEAQQ